MQTQGVITGLFLSLIRLLCDWVYLLLPDLDLPSFLAGFNKSIEMDAVNQQGIVFTSRPPWEIVLYWAAQFNTFLPVREAFQITAFAATVYLALWGNFYAMKTIKTLRGSG